MYYDDDDDEEWYEWQEEQERKRRRKRFFWGFGALLLLMVALVAWPRGGGSSSGHEQQGKRRWTTAAANVHRQLNLSSADIAVWIHMHSGSAIGGAQSRAEADSSLKALESALSDEDFALLLDGVPPALEAVKLPRGSNAVARAVQRAEAAAADAGHWLPCKLLLLQRATAHLEQALDALRQRPGTAATTIELATSAQAPLQAAARAQLAAYATMLGSFLGDSPLVVAARQGSEAAAKLVSAAALQHAEAAADAGAAALGWQWQHTAAATEAARQQLGSAWRQAAGGDAACRDELGLLRLLYEGNSSAPSGSAAEFLETGLVGLRGTEWVEELAQQPPYSQDGAPSSLADVSMAGGEQAVLESGALAWSLPAKFSGMRSSPLWSPPFQLGDTLWRLLAFRTGGANSTASSCMRLAVVPAMQHPHDEVLEVSSAALVALAAQPDNQTSGSSASAGGGGGAEDAHPFTYFQHDGPPFQMLYTSGLGVLEAPWPGPQTLSFPAGDDSLDALPGCWFPWGQPAGQLGEEQELLVVARVHRAAAGGVQLPSAPAGQAAPLRGGGGAALVPENKYWSALGQEEQQRWRLPPATPAFRSRVLRHGSLPSLAAAVLAAAGGSSAARACSGACARPAVRAVGIDAERLEALGMSMLGQADLAAAISFERYLSRVVRLIRTSGGGGTAIGWRGWWRRLTAALWAPTGAWVEAPARWALLAARSQWARKAAGAGLLALLVHQLMLALTVVAAAVHRARALRQRPSPAGQRADVAPLQPALLPWARRLPAAVTLRAHALATAMAASDTARAANVLHALTALHGMEAAYTVHVLNMLLLGKAVDSAAAVSWTGSAILLRRADRLSAVLLDTCGLPSLLAGREGLIYRLARFPFRPGVRHMLLMPVAFAFGDRLNATCMYHQLPDIRPPWAAQEEEDEDLGGVPAPMALLWWAMQACVAASALAPLAQAADRGQLDGRALLALLALPLLWGTWIHECAQLLARTCPDWDLGHTWLQQVQDRSVSNRPFDLVAQMLAPRGATAPSATAPAAVSSSSCGGGAAREPSAPATGVRATVRAAATDSWLLCCAVYLALANPRCLLTGAVVNAQMSMTHAGLSRAFAVSTTFFVVMPLATLCSIVSNIWAPFDWLAAAVLWPTGLAARTLSTSWWLGAEATWQPRATDALVAFADAFGTALAEGPARLGNALLEMLDRLVSARPRQQQRAQQQQQRAGARHQRPRSGGARVSSRGGAGGTARTHGARSGRAAEGGAAPAAAAGSVGHERGGWWPLWRRPQAQRAAPPEPAQLPVRRQAAQHAAGAAQRQPSPTLSRTSSAASEQPAQQQQAATAATAAATAGVSKPKRRAKQQQRSGSAEPSAPVATAVLPAVPAPAVSQPAPTARQKQSQDKPASRHTAGNAPAEVHQARPPAPPRPFVRPHAVAPAPAPVPQAAPSMPAPVLRAAAPALQPAPQPTPAPVPLPLPRPVPLRHSAAPAQPPLPFMSGRGAPEPLAAPASTAAAAAAVPEPPVWDVEAAAATEQLAAARAAASAASAAKAECCMCMDAPPETVLAPCGHRLLCLECTLKIRNSNNPLCPTCRTPIESFIKQVWT